MAVQRVRGVEGELEQAQTALEREQVLCAELEREKNKAQQSQDKVKGEESRDGNTHSISWIVRWLLNLWTR